MFPKPPPMTNPSLLSELHAPEDFQTKLGRCHKKELHSGTDRRVNIFNPITNLWTFLSEKVRGWPRQPKSPSKQNQKETKASNASSEEHKWWFPAFPGGSRWVTKSPLSEGLCQNCQKLWSRYFVRIIHTWQRERGAGQERWQTTVSSGVWSICTVHFLPRHVLLSPNQAWLEPANELKEEPLLRPEVCFDFKECMTRSEGFISVGNSPRLSETWCSWSTDEFWNKNLSVKHIAACPDLRPKKPFIFTYKSFVESGARNLQSYYAVIFCHF
jgi:hypothetical protein